MKYSIFDSFRCNEDLFYTIYDYLRFEKPEKWNFIHSIDDFNFMLPEEVKDLAKDAVNWLETFVSSINGYDVDSIAKNTLYYMTISYMNSHVEYYGTPTYSCRDAEDRKKVSIKTIEWLRDCINKIG